MAAFSGLQCFALALPLCDTPPSLIGIEIGRVECSWKKTSLAIDCGDLTAEFFVDIQIVSRWERSKCALRLEMSELH